MTYFLVVLFIIVAVLMMLVILVQRGRGGGLSGAFGMGGASAGSAFGTKVGDVFTWATVVLFAVFLLMAIALNFRFVNAKYVVEGGSKAPTSQDAGTMSITPATQATTATAPAATEPETAPATRGK